MQMTSIYRTRKAFDSGSRTPAQIDLGLRTNCVVLRVARGMVLRVEQYYVAVWCYAQSSTELQYDSTRSAVLSCSMVLRVDQYEVGSTVLRVVQYYVVVRGYA
eukprot:2823324-Rhodomonas_salina.1